MLVLGLEHEMQHQELLVYDIKHLLCDQFDAPDETLPKPSKSRRDGRDRRRIVLVGLRGNQAAIENLPSITKSPAHQVFHPDFAIDQALVSNGDYLEFIRDGGYQNFRWWFSEGWEAVNREQWRAPLYWELHDGEWMIRDFSGLASGREQKRRPRFARQLSSKRQPLRSGRANACRRKLNGKARRVMMRGANQQRISLGQHGTR